MKLDSYWLDTAPGGLLASEGPVEGRVDVAVVGGGFTGLSAALALGRRGASVAVLDAGRMGGGASGRNGGQCNTGVAQDYAALRGQLGVERAQGCYRAYAAAVDTVERLIREEGIDCDYLASGKLKLAAKPHHLEHLERTAELIRREVDPDIEIIGREQIRNEVESDSFHGGLLQKHGGQMHMGRFAVGLANAAVRRGARLYERAAVTSIAKESGGYRVESSRGTLRAQQVLIATGPSRHGPFAWYRRRLAPVGSFIVVTEPLPPVQLMQLLPHRRSYTTSRLMHNYFRVTPDSRLLFGGRARFTASEQPSDARSGRILQRNLAQLFPALASVRIDYCWGGLVDITADRLPRAGQHEGVWFSMGYSGHGTQMSTHMGQVMAEVMNGNPCANPWRDFAWPAIPGHTGKPWFLPLVGAYYQIKDVFY
ncbi:NAD(P)/FAD-dependent oxidoreductase [Paraburkholderia silvatlantica]|uniref:Glycine/D-amino acid oxidase-like deaminating enzyme n=1 Tax=Paraburkholderia silvatlantica TaxID=321895 RepID=A0A2U1AJD5_9BURK|nr:FAD-binding oxidoreductase [Paraburkholderia silvatlantica]MBB2927795.1 glycine/D-amino acid oxidase-like deaminating enzyme [Paraburkholderia silvatlantica]PVY36500.1 glycine/D-amino acid oxidase-like deaminating enzyme [Paraburkholderia silvatlantica]PXW28085.1 glycine/D-amino acid oxidase-like deaminating enzyme [Paraburkholderia silvatlantica]PYE20335.1 glycine/D-amino acid oxidase-like deaminating enzyme [Paraburkholderia silvatlantica]